MEIKRSSTNSPKSGLVLRREHLSSRLSEYFKKGSPMAIKEPGISFRNKLLKIKSNPLEVERLLVSIETEKKLGNLEIQKVIEKEIRNDVELSEKLNFSERLDKMKKAMKAGNDKEFGGLYKFFENLCLDNEPIMHQLTKQFKECKGIWAKASEKKQKEKYGQILWYYSRIFRWTGSTQEDVIELLVDALKDIDHMNVKLFAMGGLGKAMARLYADSLIETNANKKRILLSRSKNILNTILKTSKEIKLAGADDKDIKKKRKFAGTKDKDKDEKGFEPEEKLLFNVNHMQEVLKVLTGDFDHTSKGGINTYCLSNASLNAIYEIITGKDTNELPFIRERAALFLKEMGDNPDLSKTLMFAAGEKARNMLDSLQYHSAHEVRTIYGTITGVTLIKDAFKANPDNREENINYAMGILGVDVPKILPLKGTNKQPKIINSDDIIKLSSEIKRDVLGENYDALSLADGYYYIKKELLPKVAGKVDFPKIAALNELLAVDIAVDLLGTPEKSINNAVLILKDKDIDGTLSKYVGEFKCFENDQLGLIKTIKTLQNNNESNKHILTVLKEWKERKKDVYDLDDVKKGLDPTKKSLIQTLCTYRMSTYDIPDDKWGQEHFNILGIIFRDPELFDQIRLFDQIIGNEDRVGPRNFLFTQPSKEGLFEIKAIDHNKAFLALARDKNLIGVEHLMGFRSFLSRGIDGSCKTFHRNIKETVEKFANADSNKILDILNAYFGSSSPIAWDAMEEEEKPLGKKDAWPEAVFRLLLAEQSIVKNYYLKWVKRKWKA